MKNKGKTNPNLEEKIRIILFNHTDKVYDYFKSNGKDNFDDTDFVNRILDLLSQRDEYIGKNKREAYQMGVKETEARIRKELTKNLEVKIQLERFEERKEILEKIKSKRYRRVTGGMKQKGDLGYATNLNYCYGYNKALEDIKRKIQKS